MNTQYERGKREKESRKNAVRKWNRYKDCQKTITHLSRQKTIKENGLTPSEWIASTLLLLLLLLLFLIMADLQILVALRPSSFAVIMMVVVRYFLAAFARERADIVFACCS